MIQNILPIAYDNLGVRSMATFVETDDVRIFIDPAVSLAPTRYGLPPRPMEWKRMEESWENMRGLTAAEFIGKKAEMLEALRRELYEKYGDVGTCEKARKKLLKE